jgi:hypothetical protein
MTLSEAIEAFIRHRDKQDIRPAGSSDHSPAITAFKRYCSESGLSTLDELTGARLRDFLGRWYVEQASSGQTSFPPPAEMIDGLAGFLEWAEEHVFFRLETECAPDLRELAQSIPRALGIYSALSESLAAQGGPFGFPEFLTSFEEGGRSHYDIDTSGDPGTREGYFRVLRVEGESAEVEDLLMEERIGPVLLPQNVARFIGEGFIINLEMVRGSVGWQITGYGFVYPPSTRVI